MFPIAQANGAHGWSGSILGYISDTYIEAGEDVKAFEYFNKRLAYERKQNNVVGEYTTFKAMGAAYESKGKKTEALESYRTALEIYLKFSSGWQGEIVTAQIKELREAIERLQK